MYAIGDIAQLEKIKGMAYLIRENALTSLEVGW